MTEPKHVSAIPLLCAYILIVLAGETLAWVVGRQIEDVSKVVGLPAFLILFFAVLLLAWPLALRITPDR